MSPSVCRSAPLCFSTSMRMYFTEFILNGTERQRNGTERHYRKIIDSAISNESLCLPFRSAPMFLPVSLRQWECISLNSPIYFTLFSSLHCHNPPHGMSFTWLKTVMHSQDKVPVLGHVLKKNLHFILRNLKEEWRRKLMSWTTGMITEKCFLALQIWQGTFYAFPRHLDQPKNSSTLLETSLIPFELSLILLKQKK